MTKRYKKDYNTMGKTGFVTSHIFWGLIAMIWYKSLLFRCVGDLSAAQSRMLLLGMVAAFSASGILLEMKKRRNIFSVSVNLLFAYGGYTVLAYRDIRPELITVAFIPATAFSFCLILAFLWIRIWSSGQRFFKRRFYRMLLFIQSAYAASMAAILLVLGANMLFGSAILRPSAAKEMAMLDDSQNIADNMDTILLLQEKEWRELSVKERLDVLQTVADIEKTYLGLPHELSVGAANLKEELLGYYNDNTHEIIINLDQLLDAQAHELLSITCHEVRHSYQHRLVDAYNSADAQTRELRLFRTVGSFAEEFNDYADGFEDFCGYYSQECESDAREYAENAICDYYDRIFEYLEENQGEEA